MLKKILLILSSALILSCAHGKCQELAAKYCATGNVSAKQCKLVKEKLKNAPSGTCEAILYAAKKNK